MHVQYPRKSAVNSQRSSNVIALSHSWSFYDCGTCIGMTRDESKRLIYLFRGIILHQAWHRADFRGIILLYYYFIILFYYIIIRGIIIIIRGIILHQAWHRADSRFSVLCNQMKVFFWILHSGLCKCPDDSEEHTTSIFR
jgi:hypothetical protein